MAKKRRSKKTNWVPIIVVAGLILAVLALGGNNISSVPDSGCYNKHTAITQEVESKIVSAQKGVDGLTYAENGNTKMAKSGGTTVASYSMSGDTHKWISGSDSTTIVGNRGSVTKGGSTCSFDASDF
jgi:hypothetical protein